MIDESKPLQMLPGERIYDAQVPIAKIEALLAAAGEFAMSPATGGHGHLIPTVEMLSEQMRELRRVLYGPALGP